MSQTVINLGTGGTSLDGTLGSTTSADSNDPTFLDWDGVNYVYLSGGQLTGYPNVPDEAALDITSDIDLRVYLAMDDWTPASGQIVLSKYGAAGNRSYYLQVSNNGRLQLIWTENGTTNLTRNSTVSPVISDGQPLWIRATLDVDNGLTEHEVKFFTSPDGTTWTQLGTTVTTAGTTSIFASNTAVYFGIAASGGGATAAKFYRAQIFNGIDGTKVLDVDTSVITTGSQTSFTALTGQTVTFNRGSTGMKTVGVVSPVFLFGTDDYIEVADNSLINFSNTESFSLVAIYRQWNNFGTNDTLIAKKADTTNTTQGYFLGSGTSTAAQTQAQVGDGVAGATATQTTSRTSGSLNISTFVRNTTSDTLTTYLNTAAGTPVTDVTTLTSANTEAFRIGRLSGAGTEYSDMELVGVAVFRRALTPTNISNIVACYQERLS